MKSVTQKILVGDFLEDPVLGYLSVVLWTEHLLSLPFPHDCIPAHGKLLDLVKNSEDDSIYCKKGSSNRTSYIYQCLAISLQ